MLKLLGSDVLVRPELAQEKILASGIVLPDGPQKATFFGEILAVGPGLQNTKTGEYVPMEAEVGQRIVFRKYSARPVNAGGEELMLIDEDDVLAVVDADASNDTLRTALQ